MNKTKSKLEQLEAVVCRRQDDLFRFAYMRLGNRADAEDAVQDVFLRLFRSDEDLTRVADVERYLFRAVANRCYDRLRSRRSVRVHVDTLAAQPVPDDEREMRAEYERVAGLLSALPDEQAEVLRMRCYDALPFALIAEITDSSEATVKSRYRYVVGHLKQLLTTKNAEQ